MENFTLEKIYDELDFELVGKHLAFIRRQQGRSQSELAEDCGVDQTAISKAEANVHRPQLRLVKSICRELGILPQSLVAECLPFPLPDSCLQPIQLNVEKPTESLRRPHRILIRPSQLEERINELAWSITKGYPHLEFTLVGIASAGVVFASSLLFALGGDDLRFHVLNPSSDSPVMTGVDREMIEGRNVLLVDCIMRSGSTMRNAIQTLEQFEPSKIVTCVLIDQPDSRPEEPLLQIHADIVGYQMNSTPVFGFGMDDVDKKYRSLRYIATRDSKEGVSKTRAPQSPSRETISIS